MTPLFSDWARRHAVSPAALLELSTLLGGFTVPNTTEAGASESRAQSLIRLEAARKGVHLWRNNVGAVKDPESGSFIRYGLANDSARVNETLKSADLIGIRSVLIGPHHVGQVIGQFVSREVKRADWKWTGTPREIAQANWAALVTSLGGDACFANGEGTL